MYPVLKTACAIALCSASLAFAGSTQAAMVNYSFSGTIDSGQLSGEVYSGNFTYDDFGLGNTGTESTVLSSLSLSFLGGNYDLLDAAATPSADFLDGLLLGVTYTVNGMDPVFALVSGSGTGLPDDVAYFAYDSISGDSGFGSLAFINQSTVDEPLPLALMAIGLVGFGLMRRGKEIAD
jgi:hypothetical protein